jgi:ferric-dicitrate binding protein FerR (iron transport regulator)
VRRILGFAGGIGLGLGLAFAVSKMLRRARTELPGVIVNEARQAATSVGERMRLALEEGRRAMLDTEAELRGRVLDGGS